VADITDFVDREFLFDGFCLVFEMWWFWGFNCGFALNDMDFLWLFCGDVLWSSGAKQGRWGFDHGIFCGDSAWRMDACWSWLNPSR
jgi:hypothetical protein